MKITIVAILTVSVFTSSALAFEGDKSQEKDDCMMKDGMMSMQKGMQMMQCANRLNYL